MQRAVDIPALNAVPGELSLATEKLAVCQEFPVRVLANESSEPVAWLRHLEPTAAMLQKYNRTPTDSTQQGYDRDYAYYRLQQGVLNPLAEGREPFENKLHFLEAYGVAVAPRWQLVAEVDGIPSLLRISPHIPGTRLDEWLESTDVAPEDKMSLAGQLAIKLSAYATDIYLAHLAGAELADKPFFFDVSKSEQYIVTDQGEPILIDTGEEHLRFGDNYEGAFGAFHGWLTVGGLGSYLGTMGHVKITEDLRTIAHAEDELNPPMKVADTVLDRFYDPIHSL